MRNCEICGIQEQRCETKLFFARFPSHEDVCRQWVKVVGKMDLVYLPVMKLHQLRYVCGNHFRKRDFARSKNRLRQKGVVPSLGLTRPPLSEAILKGFPLKMVTSSQGPTKAKNEDPVKKYAVVKIIGPPKSNDHTYCRLPHQKYKDRIVEAVTEDGTVVIGLEPEKIADAVDDVRDDNADCDDDAVPKLPTPVEVAELPNELFSWEKTDAILADDTDVVSDGIVEAPIPTLDLGDVSMYDDDKTTKDDTGSECTEYRCNECEETIKGFRYTCVQCADWDLCAACEARGAHDAHYVLRVPGHRPCNEIQAVLAAIRQQMLSENLFLPEIVVSVKEEAKEEVEIVISEDTPNLEADPLDECYVDKHDDDDCDIFEKCPEQEDEDGRPPEKRQRTNEDPLANEDDKPHVDQLTHSELEIIDPNKLKTRHKQTEQHCEQDNGDKIQNPVENIEMSLREYLTLKVKKQPYLNYYYASELPLETSNTSTHDKVMESSKGTETHSKEIGAYREESGTHSKSILRRSKGLGTNRTYVRLPPGKHWNQVIDTMLKSQATVQLEDVVRKNKVLENINMTTDNHK